MRVKIAVLLLGLATFIGCAPKYRTLIRDKGAAIGWTKEQQMVAEYLSYRLLCGKENPDGTFDINYACLPNEKVAEIVKQRLNDLKNVLDFKNPDWSPYLKTFPDLRTDAEREEKIFKAVYNRLKLVDFHNKFLDLIGERSSLRPMELDLGYDSKKVFIEDVFTAYPFTSSQIEEARKNKKLEKVQTLLFSDQMRFNRKEPDPTDPNDPNKFIWQSKEIGIELVSYKILDNPNPQNNTIDYVEGTRFTISSNGSFKKEPKPALKIFMPEGRPAVIVSDYDKEGEIGFGIPDAVDNFYLTITTAEGLFNGQTISNLFQVTEQERRIKPKDLPPLNIEIAPIGNKIDVWEVNNQGWTVPVRYKNDRKDNYNIRLKIKDEDKAHFDPTASKQIEYLKKEWYGNGQVVEFFRPKPPFDNPNLVSASVSSNRVMIVTNQGEEEPGYITTGSNRVIQDNPYQIEYNEGEKRWLIVDENGDGQFEKKRQIAK